MARANVCTMILSTHALSPVITMHHNPGHHGWVGFVAGSELYGKDHLRDGINLHLYIDIVCRARMHANQQAVCFAHVYVLCRA